MPTELPVSSPTPDFQPAETLWPIATVMATGVFATTFCQIQSLGYLPICSLLTKRMGLDSNQAATFMALCTLPWTFKAVAGLLVDGVPLCGSRRRAYLLLSAVLGAVMWAMMGLASTNYNLLLVCAMGMNAALVLGSTTAGGLMVEAGQRFKESGKLSSIRMFAQNLGAAFSMPLGGYLAGKAFGWSSAVAIMPLACMFTATWLLLREPPLAFAADHGRSHLEQFRHVCRSIWEQIRNVLRWQMAVPALLLFFIQAVPTFRSTAFYEYQTKTLGYSDEALGWLSLAGYGAALFSSAAYAWLCRKVTLRVSLYAAIVLTSLSAVPYLYYSAAVPDSFNSRAITIEAVSTFLQCLAYVPLFDLAVRSTPKGSEALGFSVLISVWNVGLMIGGKAGPWLYQHAVGKALALAGRATEAELAAIFYQIRHREINHLIALNGLVTLAGVAIVYFLPKAFVGRGETR